MQKTKPSIREVIFHCDNVRPQTADLWVYDFYLFGPLKAVSWDERFKTNEQNVHTQLVRYPPSFSLRVRKNGKNVTQKEDANANE
ncbi:hypothetical protein Trydic_g9653 [Trypoxylus dichotomus]